MRQSVSVASALATLLIAGTTFAAAPPEQTAQATSPASAASSGASQGPKLSPADQKRIGAIQQYQHDLITVVALRAQPDYLLGASILAKPFKESTPGLDFDALSERAAAATDAGPATYWERLGVCKTETDCPNGKAFAYLKQHAADNAAVWLVALDVAAAKKDSKAEHAALEKAAAAKNYDDYYGQALAGVAKAVEILPPLPDTTDGAHDGQPDNPDGVRVLVAVNATQSHPRPDLDPLIALCDKAAAGKNTDSRKACLKLAHTLQWGSSPIARAAGLRIQGQLRPGDQAQTEQASRNLAWQVHQYSGLLQRSLTDPTLSSRWLAAARNGGTELSLILATLRDNQIPPDAPASGSSTAAAAGSAAQ
ncbi:MAG: hypothetical protein ACREPS_01200 [Rhodanobacteraceae bacterium]